MPAAAAGPVTGAGPALLALRQRLRPVRHRKDVLTKLTGLTWDEYLKVESGAEPVGSPAVLRGLLQWIGATEADFQAEQANPTPTKKK